MKVVAVEEIQSPLTEYIAIVKAGEELVFTQDGKPVAWMTAEKTACEETDSEDEYEAHLQKLEEDGVIRRGTGRLPDNFWDMPLPEFKNGTLSDALLEERAEGR